jgi:hypothetical protein
LSLFELWAEKESVALCGRGFRIPDGGFVWKLDRLGRWHHGSYDGMGHFIPLAPSFTLIHGNVPQKYANSRIEEFGIVFRGQLCELEQGLVILGHFGGVEQWLDYLQEKGLTVRRANAMLGISWLKIISGCRSRGLA